MTMLLIDAGNSRVKWGFVYDGRLSHVGAVACNNNQIPDAAYEVWRTQSPLRIVVSNVAGQPFAESLTALCRREWNLRPEYVSTERSAYGVETRYANFNLLGVDRWVALIGASEYAPVCVVDCGTALTLDFLSAGGVHQGGMILPGLSLMQRSLYQRAHGIQYSDMNFGSGDKVVHFPCDTQSAIEQGTLNALAGGIERIVKNWEQETGAFEKIITGGDASIIQSALKEEYHKVPDLVLRGLHRIAINKN